MTQAIRERVTIGPGGRVEIRHPDLPVGEEVDVILLVEVRGAQPAPMTSFLGQGKGWFGSATEIDAFLESERDAWDVRSGVLPPFRVEPHAFGFSPEIQLDKLNQLADEPKPKTP